MLDSDLLHEFMTAFYGYGTFSAPYWFVGMEEGGGKDESSITRRLNTWSNRGRKELEDLSGFHRDMGVDKFFSENPRLQKTWKRLILVLSGIDPREAALGPARYQSQRLGRTTGNTCLLELLPLPSPGLRHWAYGQYTDRVRFPFLESRSSYTEHFANRRAEEICRKVREHEPKLVMFYGIKYRQWWEQIAKVAIPDHGIVVSSPTSFMLMKHPNTRGIADHYFTKMGTDNAAALPA